MNKSWIKYMSAFLSWTVFVFTFPVQVTGQDDTVRQRQTQIGGVTVGQTLEGKGPMPVGILDLEGRGISELEAATLTDRMRSEMVKTGAVTIVERSQMQEILEEQGFQQTGCTSDECAVEVGKLLGVETMVSGSIGKIGQSYTLDVRMFAVETGAIVKTVNRTYRGEVDGLIMEIEKIAWEIVDLAPPPDRFPDEALVLAAQAKPEEPKKKSRTLLWLGLGVLVAGGAAAVVLAGADEKEVATIGNPPEFPTVP